MDLSFPAIVTILKLKQVKISIVQMLKGENNMRYIIDLDELADDAAFYVSQCGIPLITCKDCKHRAGAMCEENGYFVDDDFYCADAE